ncbi:MAG: hypothetical protein ABSF28_24790 [Terracidiphilus sp.]|jgi:hypothetical protein
MNVGKELTATGAVSVLTLLVLFFVAPWIPLLLAMPFNDLSIKIGSWIDSAFPSPGWFAAAGNYMLGIFIVACFEVWIGLFVFVRLMRMVMNRRAKQDAENSLSLQLK